MANAKVIRAWRDGLNGYLAVSVTEAGGDNVEYVGVMALADLQGKTAAEQKAALVAAVKAQRDGRVVAMVDLGITGNVVV